MAVSASRIHRRIGVCLVLVSIALAQSAACAGPALADPAGPFATISGTCPSGGGDETFSGQPVTAAHPSVVARITASQGIADFDAVPAYYWEYGVSDGEVAWTPWQSFAAGGTPQIEATCQYDQASSVAVPFTVELFDQPSAPATYSGVSYLNSQYSNPYGPLDATELPFSVPATAPYVAEVSLASGAISVSPSSGLSQTIASSGQIPLGTLTPGTQTVSVSPVDGPAAQWTIALAPLPITVSNVAFSDASAAPGHTETLSYSVDGDTSVTIIVANASGRPVTTLSSSLAVPLGQHSVVWDGRTANGDLVPDGTYKATVTSTDPFGNVTSANASIVMKTPPPPCTRAAAEAAAEDSTLPAQLRSRDHVSFRAEHFEPQDLACGYLIGRQNRDMVTVFSCCTVTAPTPLAVFAPVSGRWKMEYLLLGRLVYGITLQGSDVIERTPVYRPADALCCASHYRFYRLRWNGHKFTTTAGALVFR